MQRKIYVCRLSYRNPYQQKTVSNKNLILTNIVSETTQDTRKTPFKHVFNLSFYVCQIQNYNQR